MANWIDPANKSIKELETMIGRYQAKSLTNDAQYLAYVTEHAKRGAPGLIADVSIEAIRQSAISRRFISYGEVATANQKTWAVVRRLMPKHLDSVLWLCQQRGWPLITSIVVNKQHLATGEMEPESLTGFIEGAKRLGLSIPDASSFLKEQQRATFDWADS